MSATHKPVNCLGRLLTKRKHDEEKVYWLSFILSSFLHLQGRFWDDCCSGSDSSDLNVSSAGPMTSSNRPRRDPSDAPGLSRPLCRSVVCCKISAIEPSGRDWNLDRKVGDEGAKLIAVWSRILCNKHVWFRGSSATDTQRPPRDV